MPLSIFLRMQKSLYKKINPLITILPFLLLWIDLSAIQINSQSRVLGIHSLSIPYEKAKYDTKLEILEIGQIYALSDEKDLKTLLTTREEIFGDKQENQAELELQSLEDGLYLYSLKIPNSSTKPHAVNVNIRDQVGNYKSYPFFFNIDKKVPVSEEAIELSTIENYLLYPLSKSSCFENTDLIDQIKKTVIHEKEESFTVEEETGRYLEKLLFDIRDEEIEIFINSTYRSISDQLKVFKQYQRYYGIQRGGNLSAQPLCSEHHLATAVDFRVPEVTQTGIKYENSKAYLWLQQNAHNYGFINSYPPHNSAGFEYEPWHWRYIGIEYASYYKKLEDYLDPYEYLILMATATN
jgi:LAS superfamily LD-carboxypeptidase LdcB